MPTLLKLALSLIVILAAAQIGKWRPSLAGLIATMPLTGLLYQVAIKIQLIYAFLLGANQGGEHATTQTDT